MNNIYIILILSKYKIWKPTAPNGNQAPALKRTCP